MRAGLVNLGGGKGRGCRKGLENGEGGGLRTGLVKGGREGGGGGVW